MFDPFDRTGKVETFSGGARFPRIKGPRMGGNGHQSPTTSPTEQQSKLIKEIFIMITSF